MNVPRAPRLLSRRTDVRRASVRRWSLHAVALATGLTLSMSTVGARVAYAFWTNTDASAPAAAEADALPQGATPTSASPTPNPNSSTVAVQFPQATTLNGPYAIPASNYSINEYPAAGGAGVAEAASCTGTATITCNVASVPDGALTFTDTPFYGTNWVGQESAQSPAVTVDTTPPSETVSYPANSGSYGANWTGTISGTASDAGSGVASVAVAIENTTTGLWWTGTSFTASSASYQAAVGTSTWTYAFPAANLTTGDGYAVTSQASDNAGNVGTSSVSSFTYSTTTVTVSVSYPVAGTTYGANWSGTISGTASSPNPITSAQVAIENTTTGLWWNGASFAAGSQTFVVASGTTAWTYALAGANLVSGDAYSVTAKATDSMTNSATSVAAAFSYNTTPPVPALTYPVNGSTYGANWAGKLTGTAAFTNTASTVQVAIENTTTSHWYNGANFTTATTQTFLTATGTTSWTYTLAASKLVTGDAYTVIVQATDKAGNVGTSSTTAFTYSTAVPTSAVVYPVSNNVIYGANWTGTITGTATFVNAASYVTVTIKNSTTARWWNGSSFTAAVATAVNATGTTSWSYPMAAANLTSGDKYTIIAKAYDVAGNVGTSVTRTFTYNTTKPTATVTYPVNGAFYGGNWTGTITGTATFTVAASNVKVAIENTTTALWWNGTAFAAASQTFVTATGTTSWTNPLAAANLVSGDAYSVVAEATDTAGNVGVSATSTFSYNTTAPTATVGYPVAATTYGANWAGAITGTATFPEGAGSVAVAIENTTTAHWWNGTNFTTATTQTFVAAAGTTSWSYAIAASKFTTGNAYTVVAKATDAIGNTASTSPVAFAYSTALPTPVVTYPVTATTYGTNWSGAISGTAGFTNPASSVTLAVENTTTALWWNGTSFAASTQTFVTATGTTSWTYALAGSSLVSGNAYSVIADATDTAGNVGVSTTHTFTYNTTPPTAAVTYPVNGATYGPNYTGTLTGTASFTVAASSVKVAIENTTTALWWNGSTFASASQTFVTATGTTSWTFPLAISNLVKGDTYSVVAQATDTAGNVGTSATTTFTYNPVGLAGLAWINTVGGSPVCSAISATRTCTVSGVGLSGTWSADVEMVDATGTALPNVSGATISFTCTATGSVGAPVVSPTSPGTLTLATSATASTPLSITGQGVAWSVTETCTASIQGTTYSLNVAASH
jgi:large repetitive protein